MQYDYDMLGNRIPESAQRAMGETVVKDVLKSSADDIEILEDLQLPGVRALRIPSQP